MTLKSNFPQSWLARTSLRAMFIAGFSLCLVTPGHAQEEEESAQTEATEKIQVTGSRIKQIDLEGPQPLEILDRQQIQQSGMTSLNDLLNNMPAASFGSFRSGAGYGDSDFQGVNIRGLGSDNTLVLVNGKRLHKDPYFEINDLSNIPVAAVERIEILKGTASAIYGSDALAGVVNIILRKNLDGGEVSYYQTFPKYDGGDTKEVSALYGFTADNIRNTTILQWREQEPIAYLKRPWVKPIESSNGYPASYQGADDKFKPVAEDCGGNTILERGNGSFCGFNLYKNLNYQGESSRLNLINDLTWDAASDLSFNFRVIGTRKETSTNLSENGAAPDDKVTVSASRIQELINAGRLNASDVAPNEDVIVSTRFLEAGQRITDGETLALTTSLSATKYFESGYELELTLHDSRVTRESKTKNQLQKTPLLNKISSGEFDVFATTNRGSLDDAKISTTTTVESGTQMVDLIVSGQLDWEMNSGFAVGYTFMSERYENSYDALTTAQEIWWSGGANGKGDREINSIYGEFGLKPIDSLDFKFAVRHDQYSDFGSTTNPSLAFTLRPFSSLLFKGSWGTGFKAPSLREIHDEVGRFYTSVSDYKKCEEAKAAGNTEDRERYCDSAQSVEIISGGNEDLDEEKSQAWSVGFAYEPTQNNGLSFDYWSTDINDEISSPDADDVMKKEARGEDLPAGVVIERVPEGTGDVKRVILPTTNIAATKSSGLDTRLFLGTKTQFGRFNFDSKYSLILSRKTEKIPGAGFDETIGESGFPRWRLNNTFTYGIDKHSLNLSNVNIAKHQKSARTDEHVGSYTRWDAQYAYSGSWGGTMTIGYINLFQVNPPEDDTAGPTRGIGGGLYEIEGPRLYVSYTQSF